jgi:hypothetical protein
MDNRWPTCAFRILDPTFGQAAGVGFEKLHVPRAFSGPVLVWKTLSLEIGE